MAASQAIVRKQLGMSLAHEVTNWFAYVTGKYDPTELKARARSLIAKVLKDEYGKVDGWWGEWRYFPVPRLKYVSRGFPYLEFDVDLYLAASLHVELPAEEVRSEFAKMLEKEAGKVTIAGRFCESGDILVKDINLPPVSPGDIIAIPDCGAYCLPMESNYNASLKPAIVLVKAGNARLIRRRETLDDLTKCDLI